MAGTCTADPIISFRAFISEYGGTARWRNRRLCVPSAARMDFGEYPDDCPACHILWVPQQTPAQKADRQDEYSRFRLRKHREKLDGQTAKEMEQDASLKEATAKR